MNKIYIAKISGGKDSTAMVDLLLKNGYPMDYIVFNDTLAEFDEMYAYIDKLDEYFILRYKKSITRLKPKVAIDDILFKTITKGENVGKVKGAFLPQMGFCDWRLYSKMHPQEDFVKSLGFKKSQVMTYLGITTDETHRCNRNDKTLLYPLVDDFKMSERDCAQYLKDHEMENPLYRHFSRTGCAFCPAQSMQSKFNLWKYYPKVWAQIKEYEAKFKELEAQGEQIYNPFWFGDMPLSEYENKFKAQDRQTTFCFDDEPLKDCFCKF